MDESHYFALMRQADEFTSLKRKLAQDQQEARRAAAQEYADAWNSAFQILAAGDEKPDTIPDLSPLITLARIMKDRGHDVWLPEMRENFANSLTEIAQYRPAQLFFVQLLMTASKPRATVAKLATAYRSFSPSSAPQFWRQSGARDVYDFMSIRIGNAEVDKAQKDAEKKAAESKARIEVLREAASRRPAIEKQLYAVHWSDKGLGPADIRDKWNETRPREFLIDKGEAGRNDIKSAIRRGREFIVENKTSATEMTEILEVKLD